MSLVIVSSARHSMSGGRSIVGGRCGSAEPIPVAGQWPFAAGRPAFTGVFPRMQQRQGALIRELIALGESLVETAFLHLPQIPVEMRSNALDDTAENITQFPKAVPFRSFRHARKHGSEAAGWRANRGARILRINATAVG